MKMFDNYHIIAPFCSIDELRSVLDAGANEVYFGLMTKQWKARYGDSEFITRRQNELSHISSFNQMSSVKNITTAYNAKATLVLNAFYSEEQMPFVFEIISEWESRGGHSVMVADIGLLLLLNENKSKLERHLSIMAGVFNEESVKFFHQFNVSRIVLPREMSLNEMSLIRKKLKLNVDFEVITMFQKCQYIDSFCNFIHTTEKAPKYAINSGDKGFAECHGCRLSFNYQGNSVIPLDINDLQTPCCAGCQLAALMDNGIRHFKIAGRGYPVELILKAIKFIKRIIENDLRKPEWIMKEYYGSFGHPCRKELCYYK